MRPRACRLAGCCVAGLLIFAACGSEPEPAAQQTAVRAAPQSATTAAAPRPGAPPVSSLAPGTLQIEQTETGLAVRAREVTRLAFLEALERTLGLDLELSELPREAQEAQVSLSMVDASLPEVLAQLLEGIPYELRYAVDRVGGGHLLAAIRIATADDERKQARRGRRRGRSMTEEQLAREEARMRRREEALANLPSAEERAEMAARRAEEARHLVDSELPEERAYAASYLPVQGDGLDRLADLVRNDPSPSVRAAAAERLGEGDSPESLSHLLGALNDSSSEVVLSALDELEFVDDPSTLPYIRKLLDHPDPKVREAADGAADWIEEF